jgi:hypothetical protein
VSTGKFEDPREEDLAVTSTHRVTVGNNSQARLPAAGEPRQPGCRRQDRYADPACTQLSHLLRNERVRVFVEGGRKAWGDNQCVHSFRLSNLVSDPQTAPGSSDNIRGEHPAGSRPKRRCAMWPGFDEQPSRMVYTIPLAAALSSRQSGEPSLAEIKGTSRL